jgi:lipopolysaccharide biosynthesis protein
MQITFADGTKIEVKESALDDFLRHDLKWAEFVHGSASVNSTILQNSNSLSGRQISSHVRRCPSASMRGC